MTDTPTPDLEELERRISVLISDDPRDKSDLLYLIERARRAGELEKALEECEEVFSLVEHPRQEDPDYGAEVDALGQRIGFGALMASASASWRKRRPGGSEFVAGPCQHTVTMTLALIRAALRQGDRS